MTLLKQIQNYNAYNDQEKKDKDVFINYLTNFDNYLDRENEYGHLCSSAFVLNEQRDKILMVHHNIYNSWGWLGGHADGDSDLLHVAIKEVEEESGLNSVSPISKNVFTIDSLPVQGHTKRGKYVPAHVHLTLAYLLEGDDQEQLHIQEEENSGVKWVPIEEMSTLTDEPWMRYVYSKAVEKMKKQKHIN